MRMLFLRHILCNDSEINPSFKNFATLTDLLSSMIKNPLNLNVYLILIISDKMATIFKTDANEDLNDSF